MSASEAHSLEKSQRSSIQDKVAGRLSSLNIKDGKLVDPSYTGDRASTHAKQLTEEFMALRKDLGNDIPPEDFATIVDATLADLRENFRGGKLNDIHPETLRKTVYGSAVIARRPSNKPLYTVPNSSGKPGRPGTEAIAMYGNAVQRAIEQGRAAKIDLTPDKVSAHLEAEFEGLPDPAKKVWAAKALEKPGYSGYLLWVEEQTKYR
jgi:hypothetical protein